MFAKNTGRRNVKTMATRSMLMGAVALFGGVLLAGCNSPDVPPAQAAAPVIADEPMNLGSSAGVPVAASEKPVDIRTVATAKSFTVRSDPFALRPNEANYEKKEQALRVFGSLGGFSGNYATTEEEERVEDLPEVQPYRRLAGVVVGDSILALIDMGDGQLVVIRPGMTIPGTEWKVASIDSDKAVLRRGGHLTPHQVIVKLESPPPPSATGGGGFPGSGFPGGGDFPGGPSGAGRGRSNGMGGSQMGGDA